MMLDLLHLVQLFEDYGKSSHREDKAASRGVDSRPPTWIKEDWLRDWDTLSPTLSRNEPEIRVGDIVDRF